MFFDRDVAGNAVLLHTGWDRHFGTPEYVHGAPFLTEAGGEHLVAAGVALVGIDSLNIDDTERAATRPAHTGLLAAGIPVVEHLTGLDRAAAKRRPVHRGAAARRRVRHVPGARVRALPET